MDSVCRCVCILRFPAFHTGNAGKSPRTTALDVKNDVKDTRMKKVALLCVVFTLSLALPRHRNCPKECRCDIYDGKKRVVCDKGNMHKFPTSMDNDVQILVITAPESAPNVLTIGRLFLDMPALENITITHCHIPAIGDSSFWPGKKLIHLDLSHNNITILDKKDFNGLENLQVLNLNHNNLASSPSAPFYALSSLKTLLITNNKFQSLVTRFFHGLDNLKHLDLSGNPLIDFDPAVLNDVKNLITLKLANCNLSRVHSLLYQQLSNLQELDLSENVINILSPEEFRHVRHLHTLHLRSNLLDMLVEKTFDGHDLRYLDLSRNRISSISSCTFCNASVKHLDLSRNHLTSFVDDSLKPLGNSLEYLDLSYNNLPAEDTATAIQSLSKLKKLSLAAMHMTDLPSDMFSAKEELVVLDLSRNCIENASSILLRPLQKLQELDLSQNEFKILSDDFLYQLDNMTSLSKLHLHSNPWACESCDLIDFIAWMNTSSLYNIACQSIKGHQNCLRCVTPAQLRGRDIHTLKPEEMNLCEVEILDSEYGRDLMRTSKVGFVIAVAIIVILVLIIIIIIIVYKRHGAVYYTREEETTRNSMYDNPALGGTNGLSEEKKSVYVSTLGRIEEGRESTQSPITSVG